MKTLTPHPSPLTPFRWLLLAVAAVIALELFAAIARGQQIVPGLDVGGWRQAEPENSCPSSEAHEAVVRITVYSSSGGRSYGSGTLVDKDAARGIVVTAAHLFRDGSQRITACFPGQGCFPADLIERDETWDLAALKVAPPASTPVAIATGHPKPGEPVLSCGYGPDGGYWCNAGSVNGYSQAGNSRGGPHETLQITGRARDGDSGGPMLNSRGELVGVLWGTDNTVVVGSYCGRIRKFLGRLLHPGRSPLPGPDAPFQPFEKPPAGEIAEDPLVPIEPESEQRPGDRGQGASPPDSQLSTLNFLGEELGKLAGELEAAQKADADRDAVVVAFVEKLSTLDSRLSTLDSQLSAPAAASMLPVILTALGVSFPPGLAALGIAWLARRGVKRLETRNRPAGRATPLRQERQERQEAPAPADRLAGIEAALGTLLGRLGRPERSDRPDGSDKREEKPAAAGPTFLGQETGVVPRDDGEALEFLRLSELEGRSPLHDALVGRIAFDELANLAESGGSQADWAAELKRRLEQRFNEMAPVGIAAG